MERNLTKKRLREFGFLVGVGLVLFIGFFIPIIFKHDFRFWTFWIAIPFIILAILKPETLKLPYKVWMKIGEILGWINSRIILGIIFITILFPISLIMKIFGYDPLLLKRRNKFSYRILKNNEATNFTRIF